MSYNINILQPSGKVGFVEYKRAFCVQGIINGDTIPNNAKVIVRLKDKDKNIVRYCYSNEKNKLFPLYYKDLTAYEESLDINREKLNKYGFPELVVDDLKNPEKSIRNATIKCWFSDNEFKAIIVSASNVDNGSIFDDGMSYLDENNKPYKLLEIGNYCLEVVIELNEKIIAKASKDIIIGKRKNQLICRFNPVEHKNKMAKWSKENGLAIIDDLLPGYLNPYLGIWKYHMGLLKMYRANDICLFEDVNVHMIVYLIDRTSTSYATELGYLQSKNLLSDSTRFNSYYYDIGEAVIGKKTTNIINGKIIKFKDSENGAICRIDVVNDKAKENVYYLDERHVNYSIVDLSNININNSDTIAVMGVIKPYQMDSKDFILNDDNTYIMYNEPDKIKYTFACNDIETVIYRKVNLNRIENESIGESIFEFYNVFKVLPEWKDKEITVKIESIDKKERVLFIEKIKLNIT